VCCVGLVVLCLQWLKVTSTPPLSGCPMCPRQTPTRSRTNINLPRSRPPPPPTLIHVNARPPNITRSSWQIARPRAQTLTARATRCRRQCGSIVRRLRRHSSTVTPVKTRTSTLLTAIITTSKTVSPVANVNVNDSQCQSNIYTPPIATGRIWCAGVWMTVGRREKVRFKTGYKSSKNVRWVDMQRERIPIL